MSPQAVADAKAKTGMRAQTVIQRHVWEGAKRSGEMFRAARPFPHLILEHFLEEDFCRRLLKEFPAFNARGAIDENGKVGGKSTTEKIRSLGPTYAAFDDMMRSPEFLKLLSNLTGIPDLLYDPEYIGGGTHENLHGQDLDTHIDFNYHPTTQWHRRLNLLIFLNEEWKEEWGGCFELVEDPWAPAEENTIVSAAPIFNRAVFFETSEKSWHGFKKIELPEEKRHLSRKSIALYFYTRTRPPEETAPEHSTVYVDRPLPEKFREGYTLTEGDEQRLKQMISRRDAHIKRLYNRELVFSRDIEELKKGMFLPLRGFVEPTEKAEGIWLDRWTAQNFCCAFKTMRPATKITVKGYAAKNSMLPRMSLNATVVSGKKTVTQSMTIEHGVFTWEIPVSLRADENVSFSINSSNTWNPRQEGQSNDGRNLAFLLQHVIVE